MADNDRVRQSRLHQVREFCSDTTAHGLGRIAAATSWPGRVFWMAIFTVASVYSITQISQSVTSYLSYPTKTDVTLITEEQLTFPAVTVCNINPFKQSKVVNTSIWSNLAIFSNDGNVQLQAGPKIKNEIATAIFNNYKDNVTTLGHQGEELISTCEFPGRSRQHARCSHRNFSPFLDLIYGNCFTFNGSNTVITQPGHRQGFKLMLFIDADEYLSLLADSVGAVVTIHSPYVEPDMDERSIFVAPGSAVFISLLAENVTRLPYPYNNRKNCNSNITYSQTTCQRNCVANAMKKKCGCSHISMGQHPICDSSDQNVSCGDDFIQNKTYWNCSDFCHPPCNELRFVQTVSNSAWPSETHMPQLLQLLHQSSDSKIRRKVHDLDSARENMAQVNIHFSSMTVTNIKQEEAMPIEYLLGNIGGQLGLFIGVSCITLVEFLNLLLRLILPRKKAMSNQVQAFQTTER